MGSFTANIGISVAGAFPNSSFLVQPTGNIQISLNEAVASGSVNQVYNVAATIATMQAAELVSTANCSVYINQASSGSPSASLTLTAGVPLIWFVGGGYSNPLGGSNINSLYVTSSAANNLIFNALYN